MAGVIQAREYFLGVVAFTENVIDLFKVPEVTARKALLVGDEQVTLGAAQPAWKDALEENVGIELSFAGENRVQR